MSLPPEVARPQPSASEVGPARAATHAWGVVGIGDAAGVVQWVSPSVEEVLGYPPSELVGQRADGLVHRHDVHSLHEAWRAALAQPGASSPARSTRCRCRRRDGSWRELELVLTNLLAEPGVQGIVVNARTAPPAEAGTSSGPVAFHQALDQAPVMIWVTDAADRVVFFSERWYEFTGRDAETELGDGWQAGVHPDDQARVAQLRRGTAASPESFEVDYRVRAADGSYRCVVDVGVPRHDGDGAFTGHVGTVIDVTDLLAVDAAESRFRALIQFGHDLVSIFDVEGRVLFASPSYLATLGYEPDELVGTMAVNLLHPDEREPIAAEFAEQLFVTGIPMPIEHRLRHRDGSWRWVESVAMLQTENPAIGGILVNGHDVTDRRRAELISAGEARILEQVARGAPLGQTLDAIAQLVDTWAVGGLTVITTVDVGERVLHVAAAPNLPAACVEALEGFDIPDGTDALPDAVMRGTILATAAPGPAETLLRSGFTGWWRMPIVAAGGLHHLGALHVVRTDEIEPEPGDERLLKVAASLVAVAVERDRNATRLSHQALHDALTGLPNRDQALQRIRRIGRHERQGGSEVAVMFLDLDRFKVLNDSAGHEAGDRLLVSMGARLQEALRPGDLVARFGGDEFVVVCEQLDGLDAALALAERLLRVAREPFKLDGLEVGITASIGIAVADGRPAEEMVRDADAAMYRAKEKGRDRVEVFDARLREDVVERLDMERELRHALEYGGLVIYYQPIVALRTGTLMGFEALLRWQHPSRGLLDPADFLPVAEDSGLMRPVGEWVRAEVCRTAARWHQEHPDWGRFVTSINVSAAELSDPHLAANIAKLVLDSDLDPELLSFEITERILVQDTEGVRAFFTGLRELGVLLALDDFGTGYSPLLHLKEFPVDAIKIDRGLLRALGTDPFDNAIVDAVVDLAHQLDLMSVAIGIETEAQAERLRGLGCMRGQGYWYAKPMPEPLAEAWASRRAAT